MVQMVFGFFAAHGLMGADWGSASRNETDVRAGGLVGVAVASTVMATLALLIVAGANGRDPVPAGLRADVEAQGQWSVTMKAGRHEARNAREESSVDIHRRVMTAHGRNFTMRRVLQKGLGGLAGGIVLIVLNLALLGPACYSPFLIGRKMRELVPVLPIWGWSMLGALATWPLVWFRVPERLDLVFDILGALFAPVAGAISADAMRRFGRWEGPRRGVSLPGVAAWVVGVSVGLAPIVGPETWSAVRPAAVLAFAAAFVVYFALALVGLEPRRVETEG
jgi:purine-cytosine permease-like protein